MKAPLYIRAAKALFPVLLLLISFSCYTTPSVNEKIHSARSKQLYAELLEISGKQTNISLDRLIPNEMKANYGIMENDGILYIKVQLNVNDAYNGNSLLKYGIRPGNIINRIVTADVPLTAYLSLPEIKGIDYIEIGSEIQRP